MVAVARPNRGRAGDPAWEVVCHAHQCRTCPEARRPSPAHISAIVFAAFLPDGKILAPGVISHATNVVEHPELVAERLERLARIVGPERVVASTDCGFAQGPFLRRVHPTIQWAKLEALAEGARIASRNLAPVGVGT